VTSFKSGSAVDAINAIGGVLPTACVARDQLIAAKANVLGLYRRIESI